MMQVYRVLLGHPRSAFSLIAAVTLFAGCDAAVEPTIQPARVPAERLHYSEHVQPLLGRKCAFCHGGTGGQVGLRLDSWEHLIEGSRYGEVVIPFDPERSLLIEMVTKLRGGPPHGAGPHPQNVWADALTPAEVELLGRWIAEGARNDAGEVPYAGAEKLLYVCSQDAALVSVIDMEANVVIRSVDLTAHGFSANAKPHHVAVEPDGSFWYVSLIGDSKIAKFDRQNRLVAVATTPAPGLLALDPARDLLIAGRPVRGGDPPASLTLVRRSDLEAWEVPVAFPRPHVLTVSPDGRYVYTASAVSNELITLDLDSEEIAVTAAGDTDAESFGQIALSPDERQLYLSAGRAGQVHVFDLSDPARPVLEQSISIGVQPWGLAFTPDGRTAYVADMGTGAIVVVDTATRSVVDVIQGAGLANPHAIIVRPDGRYVYVSNSNRRGTYVPRHDLGDNQKDAVGTVVVIDTGTSAIVKVIEVETHATGMDQAS
jgi:YVTN family beta-propeller protein